MRLLGFATVVLFFMVAVSTAERSETFEEAKTLSARIGKPVLLEFVHED